MASSTPNLDKRGRNFTGKSREETKNAELDASRARAKASSTGAASDAEQQSQIAQQLRDQGKVGFLGELSSTRSILTGLASLGALAAGEEDVALGLATGGLLGTSQRADAINKNRDEKIQQAVENESTARGQAISAEAAILRTEGSLEQQLLSADISAFEALYSEDFQREMQLDAHNFSDNRDEAARKFQRELLLNQQDFDLQKIMMQYGVETVEELMALGGTKQLDAQTEEMLTRTRQAGELSVDLYIQGRAGEIPEGMAQGFYQMSNRELAELQEGSDRERDKRDLAKGNLKMSIVNGNERGAQTAMANLGYEENSPAMAIAAQAAKLSADGRHDESVDLLEQHLLAGATRISLTAYGEKLRQGMPKDQALDYIVLEQTAEGRLQENVVASRNAVEEAIQLWRTEATVEDQMNPAVFLQENLTSAQAAILAESGKMDFLVSYFGANDQRVMAEKIDEATVRLSTSVEGWNDMSPREQAKMAGGLSYEVDQVAQRSIHENQIKPQVEARSKATAARVLDVTGDKGDSLRAQHIIRGASLLLTNNQITDPEILEATMQQLEDDILASIEARQPSMLFEAIKKVTGPLGRGITSLGDHADKLFGKDTLKDFESTFGERSK
jgi:hypothetical protein